MGGVGGVGHMLLFQAHSRHLRVFTVQWISSEGIRDFPLLSLSINNNLISPNADNDSYLRIYVEVHVMHERWRLILQGFSVTTIKTLPSLACSDLLQNLLPPTRCWCDNTPDDWWLTKWIQRCAQRLSGEVCFLQLFTCSIMVKARMLIQMYSIKWFSNAPYVMLLITESYLNNVFNSRYLDFPKHIVAAHGRTNPNNGAWVNTTHAWNWPCVITYNCLVSTFQTSGQFCWLHH